MGRPYEPTQDHGRDWLKVGGLGCAFYAGAIVLLVVAIALVVALLRWII